MAAPMELPCALVTSCGEVNPKEVIKQILGTDELPTERPITDGIVGYPWAVENKYYTAKLELCSTPSKTLGDSKFAERLEAIIILFEDKVDSFESVKQWMSFVNQLSPSTRILACQQFTTKGDVSRHTAQLWCIENSFELVELQRAEDEEEDDEDEYDITGVKRIVSALHAHAWPNLELKENKAMFSLLQSQSLSKTERHSNATTTPTPDTGTLTEPKMDSVAAASPVSETTDDQETSHSVNHQTGAEANLSGKDTSAQHRIDNLLNDDLHLYRALGNEDPGEESFEELFSQMAAMKNEAASMVGDDNRKKYAEKVALAFWRALGGDEDEIDGLDDTT